MSADDLREVIREMMLDLDDRAHGRVVNWIVNRAARNGSGWVPAALDGTDVNEVVAFAEAARRVGYADPSDVDERLRGGVAAFLSKQYDAAHQIFGALLRPIAEGEVDLGQHEMIEEVLGVDPNECAIQYVVSAYMTTDPARRAEAVLMAINEMRDVGYFPEPIREMEGVAVEALPGLGDFLTQWRVIVESEAASEHSTDCDREADRWLREVVARLEGSDGLARLARSTKRAEYLRAWCESLAAAHDWKGALSAYEEAAEIVTGAGYARAEFLDGAALAAQEAGEQDLSSWLERAWRAESTMSRLCRWLGAARGGESIHDRVTQALEACPDQAERQRAFLCVLQGDVEQAASLLAHAPALGWSRDDHPGHLIFPLLQRLLGGDDVTGQAMALPRQDLDIDDPGLLTSGGGDELRLATPGVEDILRDAGVESVSSAKSREALVAAMRMAAETRVAGVTDQKRRRQYGHAASLVAACVACDGSRETSLWARTLREKYRRFPAFRAELDERLGSA